MDTLDHFFNKKFEELRCLILNDLRMVIRDALVNGKTSISEEIQWLRPNAARELMGITSRNSWKKLRESGEIHYVKIGKEFQYDRESVIDYKNKRSTLRYEVSKGRSKSK